MKDDALAGVCKHLTCTHSPLHPTSRRPPAAWASVVIPGQCPGTGMVSGHAEQHVPGT